MQSNKSRILFYFIILLMLILFLGGYSIAQSDKTILEGNGTLAYCYQQVSGPDLKEIYRIKEDGSDNVKIGNPPFNVNSPKWSPDGTKIVIYGYPDGSTWSIYLMNSDGSNMVRLTNTENVWDSSPSWSPDGSKIVFTRIFPNLNGREEIWVMDENGGDQHWTGIEGAAAKWSPDNLRFVYHSNHSGNYDIYTSKIDGTDELRLTFAAGMDIQPDWSPDGQKIAFSTDRNGNFDIFTINSNGTGGLLNLTDNTSDDFTPDYSPDGTKIAFESDLDNPAADHGEIYIIQTNGSNLSRVTTTPASGTAINPDWFPIDTATGIGNEFNLSIKDFTLFQNYPNPFNPNTKISYKISNPIFVSLKVFDVLGNEIATLANEEKPAGSYIVEFNGTGLPSGIYLYKIQAGFFNQTKKMILLK